MSLTIPEVSVLFISSERMLRQGHNQNSLITNLLMFGRPLKKYLVIQLLVIGFIIYVWYQLNGGFIPKFLKPRLPFLKIGPDVNALMFFGDAEDDGSKILWARQVNSQAKLEEAIKGPAHMVEGDIILRGQGTKVHTLVPVMGKPPSTDSDITLDEWLAALKSGTKGIKLDFSSIDSVEISLQKLKNVNLKSTLKFPVWLHADVLQGPHGEKPTVDATRFFRTMKRLFPRCTLSLGWTSGIHTDLSQSGYSWDMVMDMYELVEKWDVGDQPIIFQARLSLIHNSVPQLKWLTDVVSHSALMVWHADGDLPDFQNLMYVSYRFPPNELYFDLDHTDLQGHLKKYRHFSQEKLNPLVRKRDEVMFHPGAWLKMGFYMEKNSILGSTEALVLNSPIVYTVSKSRYRPTPMLSLNGRVQFLNRKNRTQENMRTGLDIYLRPTVYKNFEEIVGIRCFLGVNGDIVVTGSNLEVKDFTKSTKITPSSANCFRFSVKDAVNEVVFQVNVLHECHTLESVRPDKEVHAELRVSIPPDIGGKEHPFILRIDDNKRTAVIDELNVKHL